MRPRRTYGVASASERDVPIYSLHSYATLDS